MKTPVVKQVHSERNTKKKANIKKSQFQQVHSEGKNKKNNICIKYNVP